MIGWFLVISFFYQWVVAYFTDYNRIFRIIVEDSIIEIYCRDAKKLGNLYLWLNLRGLIREGFLTLNREFALLTDVFKAVRELIHAGRYDPVEREALLKIVEELEVKLLREFHLVGVNELHIFVSVSLFHDAISHVMDIDGG